MLVWSHSLGKAPPPLSHTHHTTTTRINSTTTTTINSILQTMIFKSIQTPSYLLRIFIFVPYYFCLCLSNMWSHNENIYIVSINLFFGSSLSLQDSHLRVLSSRSFNNVPVKHGACKCELLNLGATKLFVTSLLRHAPIKRNQTWRLNTQ